jgi:CMP-N,N'-diacetyllegionaminic acid synthase
LTLRILGLVPARGKSRRLPRKNLARLGGLTLVRRALLTARTSGCFADIVLSSDDQIILHEARGLDDVHALSRPAVLANDRSLAYDVAMHALGEMEQRTQIRYEALAVVQCTSPFTHPEDIRGAVALLQRSRAPSVVTVGPADHATHPLKLKRLDGDRLLPWFADDALLPMESLPRLWVRNGALYISRRDVLEQGKLVADDVHGYRMPVERSLDVNTELDLAFAAFILERWRGPDIAGSGPACE